MELYEQIISKEEINSRAVDALLAIIANGLVATKTDLAEALGAKPAKFSEILNYRMKVGVDMIAKMCDWYYVDPDWLLMGRGNKIFKNNTPREPYFIEDENDLDRIWHNNEGTKPEHKQSSDITPILTAENNLLREQNKDKDMTIQQQAKEIGRLEQRIKELEQQLGKTAGDANIGGTSNAG